MSSEQSKMVQETISLIDEASQAMASRGSSGSSLKRSGDSSRERVLVVENPCFHPTMKNEPIERKRELWTRNLISMLKEEKAVPENTRIILAPRSAPKEPYRLAANVVRLIEQEPQLYTCKAKKPRLVSSEDSLDAGFHSWSDDSNSSDGSSFHWTSSVYHPSVFQTRKMSTTAEGTDQQLSPDARTNWKFRRINRYDMFKPRRLPFTHDPIGKWIRAVHEHKSQKEAVFQRKLLMLGQMKHLLPGYKLTLCGSTANGFGSDNADVDVCVQMAGGVLPGSAVTELRNIKKILKKSQGKFAQLILIEATVPILCMNYHPDRGNGKPFQVELNFDSIVSIQNTQLMFVYSQIEPRVTPLVLAMKQWSHLKNIHDAQKGFFSSYGLTLLVIFYLQTINVVPVLHSIMPEFSSGACFGDSPTYLVPGWISPNQKPAEQIFREMVAFYAQLDFTGHCISIKHGKLISKAQAIEETPVISSVRNPKSWWKFVSIQEPFTHLNVARSITVLQSYARIKSAFEEGSAQLEATQQDQRPAFLQRRPQK